MSIACTTDGRTPQWAYADRAKSDKNHKTAPNRVDDYYVPSSVLISLYLCTARCWLALFPAVYQRGS